VRILFLRKETLEVGQSPVANAGLAAEQETATADENVESADAAYHVVLGIDVEHRDDEVAEELSGVAVKLVDRLSGSCGRRRRGEAFEESQVRLENFADEGLPQLGPHHLLAFQQVENDLLAGLPNVDGLWHHPELYDFSEDEVAVDDQEEKFAKLGAVDVDGMADAESALQQKESAKC